jgi:4-hydroxy-tetrahydrodipicolinate synthase
MPDRAQIREALTGPITSIRTPFNRDGKVDHDGLRNTIDFNIAAGSKTMLLTAGDSHLITLSDQEIADISRIVVDHTAGQALVVTADRYYNTNQAIAFAEFAAAIGSDVHMVLPPDWGASCTPETLRDHYARIADIISVMVVTNVFMPRGEDFGLQTLELVYDTVENVVAIKDDMLGAFARKMTLLVRDRWAVFSGGQKQNHLDLHPYGCHGFMSTFLSFKPDITHRYWSAIQSNDLSAASDIIYGFDHPFFDLLKASPGGFDAALHGVFELFGIYSRWRPAPYYNLSDSEMDALSERLVKLDITPA